MKTTVQRAAFPDHRRILMISDIHAHADGLKAVLDRAGYSKDDILVIVGDLVEKGTQSLKTIRMIMDLRSKYAVYPIMGNVDLWRLEFLQSKEPVVWKEMQSSSLNAKKWWGNSLLHEMCEELGESLTQETDITSLFPQIQRRFAEEIAFLESLPTILETQKMIFVHGGIPHERLDELAGTDAYPLLKFDNFYGTSLSFQKYVVTGHWPSVLYSKTYPVYSPLIDRKRRIIALDGACGIKREGQLNLLSIPDWQSEDFSLFTWDDLPVITALEDQKPSPAQEARYIRWNDHAVKLLCRGEEMSQVMYHGKPMSVPTQYIFLHNGVLSCSDVTDYVLPVSAGETMFLILPLKYGCFVKKNNVSGWYFGRYKKNGVN